MGVLRQKYDSEINQHLIQGLNAVKDVKIYGTEKYFLTKFNIPNFNKSKVFTNQVTLQQIPRLYLELLSIMGLVGLIVIKMLQHKPLDLLLPTLGVFVAAAFRMLPSVNRIMSSIQGVKFAKPVVDVLYNEFKIIRNVKNTSKFNEEKISFINSIDVSDICFKYEGIKNTPCRTFHLI